MADLKVTLGADTSEFEKGVKQAGKTVNNELKSVNKGINFAENLMSGNVGAAVGSLFGPIGEAVGQFVDTLLSKAKDLIDKAVEIRNLSLQTGLSTEKIQRLESVAKESGISVQKLADSINEFDRRLGYARLHGGELNVLLNKLGVSMEQIRDGTFNYFDALEKLRIAQEAGTEEAILNHYAQVMLGSSYKELKPLIEQGSESLKKQGAAVEEVSNENIAALVKLGAYVDVVIQNIKNGFMNLFGIILRFLQVDYKDVGNAINEEYKKGNAKQAVEAGIEKIGYGVTAGARSQAMYEGIGYLYESGKITAQQRKELFDELSKRLPTGASEGKPLLPFGAEMAQGASTMQSMGGGDLFGAMSFSPAVQTAENTKLTAEQVTQLNSKIQPEQPLDPKRENLNR
jgi:hypothetical protein